MIPEYYLKSVFPNSAYEIFRELIEILEINEAVEIANERANRLAEQKRKIEELFED